MHHNLHSVLIDAAAEGVPEDSVAIHPVLNFILRLLPYVNAVFTSVVSVVFLVKGDVGDAMAALQMCFISQFIVWMEEKQYTLQWVWFICTIIIGTLWSVENAILLIDFGTWNVVAGVLGSTFIASMIYSGTVIRQVQPTFKLKSFDLQVFILGTTVVLIISPSLEFDAVLHMLLDLRMFFLVFSGLFQSREIKDILSTASFFLIVLLIIIGFSVYRDTAGTDLIAEILYLPLGILLIYEASLTAYSNRDSSILKLSDHTRTLIINLIKILIFGITLIAGIYFVALGKLNTATSYFHICFVTILMLCLDTDTPYKQYIYAVCAVAMTFVWGYFTEFYHSSFEPWFFALTLIESFVFLGSFLFAAYVIRSINCEKEFRRIELDLLIYFISVSVVCLFNPNEFDYATHMLLDLKIITHLTEGLLQVPVDSTLNDLLNKRTFIFVTTVTAVIAAFLVNSFCTEAIADIVSTVLYLAIGFLLFFQSFLSMNN